jgi:hypothetical protein
MRAARPSAYSPLGIALMGLRIAEINEDVVAQVFRNKPPKRRTVSAANFC